MAGGRAEHFTMDHPTFSKKLTVFAGIREGGTFGLTFYRDQTMNGDRYYNLLRYTVIPELKRLNGGTLDG